ncbi:hypothetical protein ACQWCB_24215, partial [Salmonella enterica subsp. enterica serovar Infantis]
WPEDAFLLKQSIFTKVLQFELGKPHLAFRPFAFDVYAKRFWCRCYMRDVFIFRHFILLLDVSLSHGKTAES